MRYIYWFNPKLGLDGEECLNKSESNTDPNIKYYINHWKQKRKNQIIKAHAELERYDKSAKYDALQNSFWLRLKNLFK